jgi:hypothetical protein
MARGAAALAEGLRFGGKGAVRVALVRLADMAGQICDPSGNDGAQLPGRWVKADAGAQVKADAGAQVLLCTLSGRGGTPGHAQPHPALQCTQVCPALLNSPGASLNRRLELAAGPAGRQAGSQWC